MSVIVTKDTYLSNGDRQVTISPNCYLMQTKDHGIIAFEIQLVAINNKLTTRYVFKINISGKNIQLSIPIDKRLVLFDKNKNYCILTYSAGGGCTDYARPKKGFTVTARTNYVIDESNIEKLKRLERTYMMRIETVASFIEVESLYNTTESEGYDYHPSISEFMIESIFLAQKTILKSSADLLKFE